MPARDWNELFPRIERLLDALEQRLFPAGAQGAEDKDALAFRWRGRGLEPIAFPDLFPPDGLIGVERSVDRLRANVDHFTQGEPALDCLLYGERGTGKSSAVRGLLTEFGARGFRLVELQRDALRDLPEIFAALRPREERFGLFLDDLSFEAGDASYKELKAILDGGIEARPANVLFFATSNRRHLVAEHTSDNDAARLDANGQLHPGETAEEKISLSDRFGLLLPFLAFDQDTFLAIVDHYARGLGLDQKLGREELHSRALRFALVRAGRTGRSAKQACIAIGQELPS